MATEQIIDQVEATREAWLAFLEQRDLLVRELRHNPETRMEAERWEAYGAGTGRDEGMGYSMEAWLAGAERAARGDDR